MNECSVRLLYFIDANFALPGIMVLPTSGDRQQLRTLISDMERPTALTIDFTMGGRLFWADEHKHFIESCKPDGTDRTKMLDDIGTISMLPVFPITSCTRYSHHHPPHHRTITFDTAHTHYYFLHTLHT